MGWDRSFATTSAWRHPHRVWNFDVDLEGRHLVAAVHADVDPIGIDLDVTADGGQDLLAQKGKQIGGATRAAAFIGKQDLQAITCDRGGALAPEQIEQLHAALRPNNLPKNPCFSVGTVISTSSPMSRRAASRWARAGALDGLLNVTGEPRFEARRTSSLSGIMPSNGVDRISRTSSMLSISPRAARAAS